MPNNSDIITVLDEKITVDRNITSIYESMRSVGYSNKPEQERRNDSVRLVELNIKSKELAKEIQRLHTTPL